MDRKDETRHEHPVLRMKTEQSTRLKKCFSPCIETKPRRLYSHRALTCSGGLLTGGGGLALGEEVEVWLWLRRWRSGSG